MHEFLKLNAYREANWKTLKWKVLYFTRLSLVILAKQAELFCKWGEPWKEI